MIGRSLGPYEIREEIGKGGMATVYKAYQKSIDRFVALKIIHKSIVNDPDSVLRFQREARLIARLEHPHILPVYDFDGAHDPPYIVMRLMETGTLKDVMSRAMLPHDEINFLFRQVCSALDYAHRQGIIHRDIKPSNIMIDTDGNAFVTDLGIARIAGLGDAASMGPQITATGAIVGTPDYMSPEQARGDPAIDHRADLYAMGVLLFQMLTGRLPFERESTFDVLTAHIFSPAPSPHEFNASIKDDLAAVVLRALAKDPEDRFSTASDFALELSAAMGGTLSSVPVRLRQVASETMFTRSRDATRSRSIASEENKAVTVVNMVASEYAELVAEERGTEAAQNALRQLWDQAAQIIVNRAGTLVSENDETLMAVWGAASANEDDPQQAIRAALDVRETLQAQAGKLIADDDYLPINIGIHTGFALLAPSEDGDVSASGATISLTNRLAQQAFGKVLITHDTFVMVRGYFELEQDEPLRMRGQRENLDVYRVEGVRERGTVLLTRGVEGVETPLVGREADIQRLQNAFLDSVEEAETQMVTIYGDAGLGKTRLLLEFEQWTQSRSSSRNFTIIQAMATANMTHRPYALLRDALSIRFDIRESDPSDVVRDKLKAGIAGVLGREDIEMATFIGFLCGFDVSNSNYIQPLRDDPQQLDQLGRRKFVQLIEQVARDQHAVILMLEDLHHADDATLDLLIELVNEADDLPLLVVCSARPVFHTRRPNWGSGQSFHQMMELEPLDRRSSRQLVREILKRVPQVPRNLRDLIVDYTRGNPYFIEEVVKILIDDNVIRTEGDTWTVDESRAESVRLPPTLMGLLQARFDTLLFPEKVMLQRASVMGNTFYDAPLIEMNDASETIIGDVQNTLERLINREFIERRETSSFADATEYTFTSALMRDMVYETILRRHRMAYHKVAALWLEQSAPDRAGEYQEVIAHHYEEAGEGMMAALFLQRAAQRAEQNGQYKEAAACYQRALVQLPEDSPQNFFLQVERGSMMTSAGDYADARPLLEEALVKFDSGEDSVRARALEALARIAAAQGRRKEAEAWVQEAMGLLEGGDDLPTLQKLRLTEATLAQHAGQWQRARETLSQILQDNEERRMPAVEMRAFTVLGLIALFEGHLTQAQALFLQVSQIARAIGHVGVQATALNYLAETYAIQGDWQEAQRWNRDAFEAARNIGSITDESIALLRESVIGLANQRGDYEEPLREGVKLAWDHGRMSAVLEGVLIYAQVLLLSGEADDALTYIGLVEGHEAATIENQAYAHRVLSEFGIDAQALKQGRKRAKDLTLADVVGRILGVQLAASDADDDHAQAAEGD